jgi:hypothetical protein
MAQNCSTEGNTVLLSLFTPCIRIIRAQNGNALKGSAFKAVKFQRASTFKIGANGVNKFLGGSIYFLMKVLWEILVL